MNHMEQAEKLNILSKFISIKTVNDNEKDLAYFIKDLFDEHEIFSEILPLEGNRANLVAEIGDGDKILAFSGHMDTVMAGDGWDHSPFKMTEDGNELYGRGTTDMKAGLAAMVIAMIELKQSKVKLNGKLRLLVTAGEEVSEYGAEKLTDDGYMDDVSGLVIGEPSAYNLGYTHMGSLDIRISSKGKAAHASLPSQGFNAIVPLLDFLSKAKKSFDNIEVSDPVLGPFIYNIDTIAGGTQVNAIPSDAVVEINFRTIPQFNNDQVIAEVRKLVDEVNEDEKVQLTTEIILDLPVVQAGKNSSLINLVANIESKYFGNKVVKIGIPGTTDAAKFLKNKPADFPLVITGPGNLTMHMANESVPKDMYFDFVDIYKKIATDYLY